MIKPRTPNTGKSNYPHKKLDVLKLSESEIKQARKKFIEGEIELSEFERIIEGWLRWEMLSPSARREFEMNWVMSLPILQAMTE